MSKNTTVSVVLDQEAYSIFQDASEIVAKAGIRVPPGQLVQTMINAEMARLSAGKIAQRFLKSIIRHVGAQARTALEEEMEEDKPPHAGGPPSRDKVIISE